MLGDGSAPSWRNSLLRLVPDPIPELRASDLRGPAVSQPPGNKGGSTLSREQLVNIYAR